MKSTERWTNLSVCAISVLFYSSKMYNFKEKYKMKKIVTFLLIFVSLALIASEPADEMFSIAKLVIVKLVGILAFYIAYKMNEKEWKKADFH